MKEFYEIKELEPKNRGVLATKQIKQGQRVMETQPMASATLKAYKNQVCNHCLMKNDLFRCSLCKSFYYCTKQCQKKDWAIHKHECKIYQNLTNVKKLSVHNEIASEFILNLRIALQILHQPGFQLKFFNMISQQDHQPFEKRQHFQEMAVVLLQNMGQQRSESNMSKMVRQLNVVAVNAFTVQDFLGETDGVGIGVYCPTNYINHDCQPNCTQYFDGRYLNIVANKSIEPGEEITISYTNPLVLAEQRKKFLRSNYLFECFCQLCQVQQLLDTKLMYILCPTCQKQLQKLKQEEKVCYNCSQCDNKIDLQEMKKRSSEIQKKIKHFQILNTYADIKRQFFNLRKELSLNHPYFAEAIDKLYHATINYLSQVQQQKHQKILQQAYILLKEQLKGINKWYRLEQGAEKNIRFFIKYAQFGKLCYNLGKFQKAFEYTQLANNLVKQRALRNKYQQVAQLQKRFQQIKIELSMAKSKSFNSS